MPPTTKDPANVRSERAAWGTITRDQIVAAAVAEVRDRGFQALSIRSLAEHLGVAPMSLYRHVRNKDDLLDELANQMLGEMWRSSEPFNDGRTWLIDCADRLRQLLVDQPVVLHVYLAHPVVNAATIERMNEMIDVLNEMTPDDVQARKVYFAIHTFTLGFATLEASRRSWQPNEETSELALELGAMTMPEQFRDGIGSLLDGILKNV